MKTHKLFFITCLTILFVVKIFGQAQIEIPFTVTDNYGNTQILIFGLDTTATSGIDPYLGEIEIPPFPPTGAFDARFISRMGHSQLGNGTLKDIRNAPSFPFSGTRTHRIRFNPYLGPHGINNLTITISWNLPPQIAGGSTITDIAFGGSNSQPFVGTGSMLIEEPLEHDRIDIIVDYVNIGGNPNDPIFDISTTHLNFPPIPVGSVDSLLVTISNLSLLGTLYINEINSSNNIFTITPNSVPIAIGPESSQTFIVTCAATDSAQQGTIEFVHNAYGSPAVLNVSAPPGIQPGPSFHINPSTLIFPRMPAGTIDSLPVTISNYGYQNTLYINQIISTNNNFSILPNSVPIAIEPLSYTTFYVTCLFTDTLQQGIIKFTHNAPGSPSILNVVAVYSQAQFSVYPASRLFTIQPGTRTFWVSNLGVADTLIIIDIISSNSNYTVNPITFPISIPPGSTASINVSLNSTPGFQFGIIEFLDNASGSPHSVCVSNQMITPTIGGLLIVQSGSEDQEMWFGLDRYATDEIDRIFGENDLPPPPPTTAFDARYILPQNNFSGSLNSCNDCRYGIYPFIEQREFRISYQPAGSNGIEIFWYLPEEVSGVLMDLITGNLINVPIADTGSFIVQDPETFNKLKMLIDFNMEVPVELILFNATLLDNNVRLDWTTATERNNSGFAVERISIENSKSEIRNSNWTEIGFVPGFGTTTEPKSYSFIDESITTGTYKYRLKQIDYDGSFEYSNEIEVDVDFTPKEFVLYQNYPNPFNPRTVISYQLPVTGNVTLKVYDVLGNEVATLVNEEKQPGVYEVEFGPESGIRNPASGVYFYQLKAGSFIDSKKMILLR